MSTPVEYRRAHRRMVRLTFRAQIRHVKRGDRELLNWDGGKRGQTPVIGESHGNSKPKSKDYRRLPTPKVAWLWFVDENEHPRQRVRW